MYMFISRHQNAGQNHNIQIDIKSLESVGNLQYLGEK